MKYENEKAFLDEVEIFLKSCGCRTWREVIPDSCKDWDKPYRVDLVIYRDDFGYIGVEGKNINTLRSAVKFSDAIDQINNKYRNQTYFSGNLISRWCIIAPMRVDWISEEGQDLTMHFLKNFFNSRYDISLMEYRGGQITIDPSTRKSLYIRRQG